MVRKKGFTMIEMLIVIAVLGILAAALLATIDPFEQMKKARDTTLRNSVIDYLDACTRYYSVTGAMPWWTSEAGYCTMPTGTTTLANLGTCTTKLEDTGELKAGFATALGSGNAARIFVDGNDFDDLTDKTLALICFQPDSKSIQNDPNTICTSTGGAGCTPGECYWCTDIANCGGGGT